MSPVPKTSASVETLTQRARFLSTIRRYFEEQGVLEVQTPTLAPNTVTDPHTESFSVSVDAVCDASPYFLQTSPEYALKRLLASGVGSLYQMGPAYRYEVSGRWHQPEFTMLEWYRVGWDDRQLMDDVTHLLKALSFDSEPVRETYQKLFQRYTGLDPLTVSDTMCREWLRDQHAAVSDAVMHLDRDALIQYVFATYVETAFDPAVPTFVMDFPATQAALARLDPDNPAVARRFELYVGGLECANGFYELSDPLEQGQRFERDQAKRAAAGLPARAIDPAFIQALEQGLPDCAGVALGVDRLFAASVGADALSEVMALSVF